MEIFCSLNRVSDSVNDAESHDTKILTRFHGNPTLEILVTYYGMLRHVKQAGFRPRLAVLPDVFLVVLWM